MVLEKVKKIAKRVLSNYDEAKNLSVEEVTLLLEASKSALQKQSVCKRIEKGSTIVVGDIHGDFEVMKQVVRSFYKQKTTHLIFLGDIVDRGSNSIACISLLFSLILERPKNVHIVRGNHEALSVNSRYGFLDDVQDFSNSKELYALYNQTFSEMPLTLIHEEFAYFFVHGGIPINTIDLKDFEQLPKGDLYLDNFLIKQLLWNDPKEEIEHFGYSMRGMGIHTYGEKLVDDFLEKNNLKMIIRAHEAFPEGFKYFFDGKLLSLFTSEEYYSYIQAKIAVINSKGQITIQALSGKME